ncbi:MAG: PfkB family carbohydrate kinase [Pyrinomonadaceae bacterium]|nr:PfkB family carbohydrate kinase [Pyrinomonadaceae bacterium]
MATTFATQRPHRSTIGERFALPKGHFIRRRWHDLAIFDRVGGGDSFASGLIYGFLTGETPEWAVNCGAAHGALAMTTPGDTTTVGLADVLRVMKGGGARVAR